LIYINSLQVLTSGPKKTVNEALAKLLLIIPLAKSCRLLKNLNINPTYNIRNKSLAADGWPLFLLNALISGKYFYGTDLALIKFHAKDILSGTSTAEGFLLHEEGAESVDSLGFTRQKKGR
jgi:hypothetical protein